LIKIKGVHIRILTCFVQIWQCIFRKSFLPAIRFGDFLLFLLDFKPFKNSVELGEKKVVPP
jgi:hypothetical protein